MAEVEKVSAAVVATTASDIPVVANSEAGGGSADLGTSPTQERSSNSHPHDSEYDTASDLEGGEDYDDDDDDLDDDDDEDGSMTDEDDEGESMTDDDERPLGAGGIASEKAADAEAQKKVDEDRSNPQYIPKRGTFYEHDDRTAECEADVQVVTGEGNEQQETGTGGVKSPQSPTISQASKTMKKWQPASAVERWSHDRFDASEQAPKSRTELVSSYGYDIRTEDAPPRARRRRRYGRGPSKYLRNWEDENAYLKASNKERKPLRPSDFPALAERGSKTRKPMRGTREEKENRMNKRPGAEASVENGGEKLGGGQHQYAEERREPHEPRADGRTNNKHKGYGRPSAPVGRQAAMEFKQKQRNAGQTNSMPPTHGSSQNSRMEQQQERYPARSQNAHHSSLGNEQQHQKSSNRSQQSNNKNTQSNQNEAYNNNMGNNSNRMHEHAPYQQVQSPQQQQLQMRQPLPAKTTPTSNLSQRLQQVQQRNDPSHVGSVQMHALASQNQLIGQQPPPPQPSNIMLASPQQQQQQPPPAQQPQLAPQEQRGPPKRYSSLRRSQQEAQHIAEQHQQLQQLHLQQQPPPLLLQDQHMLQAANLMLYHQENLQAQMQALQVGPTPTAAKQPAYATAQGPPPQPYGAANSNAGAPPPAAYYVAAPDAYTAAATVAANAQATQPAQYAPQPPANYLPQAPSPAAAATLAYTTAAPPAVQQAVPGAAAAAYVPPAAVPSTAPAVPATQAAPPNANPNYPNYQNYNTVGGTTYFVPPPAQATSRPAVLPQRRPTNAIPILPPSEKNKQRPGTNDAKEDAKNGANSAAAAQSVAPIGSAENIDHIIDNMFVQRPAFQPPTANARKSATPPSADNSLSNASDANSSPSAAQSDDSGASKLGSNNTDKAEDGTATSAAAVAENNGNAVVAVPQE